MEKSKKIFLKSILYLFCLILIFNICFVVTDAFADKKWFLKELVLSPLSNENWLSFWGSAIGGIATFLTVFVMVKTHTSVLLQKEKEEKRNRLKKEIQIIIDVLSELELYIFNKSDMKFEKNEYLNSIAKKLETVDEIFLKLVLFLNLKTKNEVVYNKIKRLTELYVLILSSFVVSIEKDVLTKIKDKRLSSTSKIDSEYYIKVAQELNLEIESLTNRDYINIFSEDKTRLTHELSEFYEQEDKKI